MTALPYLTDQAISHFIKSALEEDIGEGDHTSMAAIPAGKTGNAELRIKDHGMLAGVALAQRIFLQYDERLQIQLLKNDGDGISPGAVAFVVTGPARSILSTERLVLNCMQRMSGIATYTDRLCALIKGTQARIMDTRKTTPNFRLAEKWAVAIGGGLNHRYALDDMIMLKDNHVELAGGVERAINHVKDYLSAGKKLLPVEIETRNLEEVREALGTGEVQVIMLDNMSLEEMRKAVKIINGKCKTEASGGINESNLREVAECGVDYISVGALTHSVKSLDMSLKITM